MRTWLKQACLAQGVDEEDIEAVADGIMEQCCRFEVIYPTLFASLKLNGNKQTELIREHGEDSLQEIFDATNGYTLLALQEQLGLQSARSIVDDMLGSLRKLENDHKSSDRPVASELLREAAAEASKINSTWVRRIARSVCSFKHLPVRMHAHHNGRGASKERTSICRTISSEPWSKRLLNSGKRSRLMRRSSPDRALRTCKNQCAH